MKRWRGTKGDRVRVLLEHFVDVELGLRDKSGGEPIPLMCRSWNHRSYRTLRALLQLLKRADREAYLHVRARYLAVPTRQALVCPRCDNVTPSIAWSRRRRVPICRPCKVLGRTVTPVPKLVRELPDWFDEGSLERGVKWLVVHFPGRASLPEDILAVLEQRDPDPSRSRRKLDEVAA